ncbi:eukaryotic translation initiation factor 4 gamma 3-like isoform X2 [Dinothrombium tinctorium]|uniref:Eukaryotic translation initiation factor 4 gamma 3-like isoform X2 n=1 Tax=Dinothrombium tinctorium TaxID=1965070 RepID=A0A3S3PYM2_9ACAR|nr:eukaryotic translation initiation factor 4 gamma 3-like isoform X2 [Dinothrombium tinctorium]
MQMSSNIRRFRDSLQFRSKSQNILCVFGIESTINQERPNESRTIERIVYSPDFMRGLRDSALSRIAPQSLHNLEIVRNNRSEDSNQTNTSISSIQCERNPNFSRRSLSESESETPHLDSECEFTLFFNCKDKVGFEKTRETFNAIINLIIEKAVDDPIACGQLCKNLASLEINQRQENTAQQIDFRSILIDQCKYEFERNIYRTIEVKQRSDNGQRCRKSVLIKRLAQEKLNAKKEGIVRLMGELYKEGIIDKCTIVCVIEKLLLFGGIESIRSLCYLFSRIGEKLRCECKRYEAEKRFKSSAFDFYMKKLQKLSYETTDVDESTRRMIDNILNSI